MAYEGLGELFDIKLEGKGYRIRESSYQEIDVVDFSPRGATPGGSNAFSDLQIYQPLTFDDWSHGFGFVRNIDIQGFMKSEGNIDARHMGYLMMFTKATLSKTFASTTTSKGGFVFGGKFYVWGSNGLWRLDTPASDTWTQVYSGDLNYAMANGTYVFVFKDGARPEKSTSGDAASWSDAGADANADDFGEGFYHNGYYFAIEDGTQYIHYASETDLSDLEGDGENDADVIIVGAGALPLLKLWSHGGKLWAFNAGGIYEIGDDFRARLFVNKMDELSSQNFLDVDMFHGDVYYPVQNQLFGWNGAAEIKATPSPVSDTWPFTTYGRFDNFVTRGDFFYCVGRTNESTYQEDLLAFDGGHWFKLCNLVSDGASEISMLALDVENQRLWYHVDGQDELYYIPIQELSEFPYADFPTSGTHRLTSSKLDMEYRRIVKSSPSVIVSAQNLNESGRQVTIDYSLDGDTYVSFDPIKKNGTTEQFFDTEKGTVEYHYITLRAQLETDDATETPVIENITLRFMMRPKTLYGWGMEVVAADFAITPSGVSESSRKASEIEATLKKLRDQAAPIDYLDINGYKTQVYLTSMQKRIRRRDPENWENGAPVFQYAIQINLIEVGGVVADVL